MQALDGIGLGILDALIALILADIMRGTGRYNVARGIVGTVQGVGGSLSNVVAGLIVVTAGYAVPFLTLAAVAVSAFIFMMAAMPETGEKEMAAAAGDPENFRSRRSFPPATISKLLNHAAQIAADVAEVAKN